MVDYELKDIRKDLVEPSNEVPVVIDFWAPWCGPCKTLGPLIEKLAAKAAGKWKLVKINVDDPKNQPIAQQFQIRSIPAVRMLFQGQILGSFEGALPEAQLKQWLKENLPESEDDNNDEEDEISIDDLLAEGKRELALEVAKKIYSDDQKSDTNKIQLALLLLPGDLSTAGQLFSALSEPGKYEIEKECIKTLESLKQLLDGDRTLEKDGSADAIKKKYVDASSKLFSQDFDGAAETFIEVLMADRTLDDDGARKACISLFKLLGEKHPVTLKYRRRFSMALY
ncbi:MAG: tetratricopeptide repeat protein [Balneolales bacterium]|nr:tetratricopeptide repeat protein [Balneolales bacterium]